MTSDPSSWDDMVLVGRIARPHGLRGHVFVNPETDFAEARFRPGAVVWMRAADGPRALTVASARMQSGRPVIGFEGLSHVDEVETLAGAELRVPEQDLQPLGPGHYYEHQLVGCRVETLRGEQVGVVSRVEGGAGGSRLIVDGRRGEVLIPLAADICVDVDIAARTIRVDPPEGLLELNVAGSRQ